MSQPAERTETLRTRRNAIKIINQAVRRSMCCDNYPVGQMSATVNTTCTAVG